MKQKFLSSTLVILIMLVLFLMPILLHAQFDPPPDDPGADSVPIDGCAIIVASECAGYLAKCKQQIRLENR
jgi:hypothetical protein